MSPSGYVAEVSGLSPNATEKDINDFFALCGMIEHVEIIRAGEHACTAYVTFRGAYALETAVLLSGATIVDQPVFIARWGNYEDEFHFWNQHSGNSDYDSGSSTSQARPFVSSAGEAVTIAQDVVKAMLAKGYVLSKDALSMAKAFDESHHVSATAAAKVAELSYRIGLTDKIVAGVDAVKSVDQRYHIADTTWCAVSATGRTAVAAATTVVNSSYFSKGALWLSDALTRAAKVTADLGSHGVNK